jgi:hypothetical protein
VDQESLLVIVVNRMRLALVGQVLLLIHVA